MKKLLLCAIAILACSCRQGIGSSRSAGSDDSNQRLDEVRKIVREYYNWKHDFGDQIDFEIRGPLTIAQVEEELIEQDKELLEYISTNNVELDFDLEFDLAKNESWREFKSSFEDGDEFYFFTSDDLSWAYLHGIKGYVIIRKNEVLDTYVTMMN